MAIYFKFLDLLNYLLVIGICCWGVRFGRLHRGGRLHRVIRYTDCFQLNRSRKAAIWKLLLRLGSEMSWVGFGGFGVSRKLELVGYW